MTNTHFLTLGEAAKVCGYSKPTISKALKSGKLSYVEKVGKEYRIDPAELNRVFPSKHALPAKVDHFETPNLHIENTRLQAELKGKDREIELLAEQVKDLRETTKLLAAPKKAADGPIKLLGIIPIAWR